VRGGLLPPMMPTTASAFAGNCAAAGGFVFQLSTQAAGAEVGGETDRCEPRRDAPQPATVSAAATTAAGAMGVQARPRTARRICSQASPIAELVTRPRYR
jgi:hypothetical protein